MGKPWGRLYAGTRNHRKIKILAQRLPALWPFWYVLIDLAIEVDDAGWIYVSPDVPYTYKELAKELRIRREDHVKTLCKTLEELKLVTISDKGILLNSFSERNFESDNSLQRVKKYRDNREKLGLARGSNYDREFVLSRDNYECIYCGSTEKLCVDHMLPTIKGGDDNEKNLACACKSCNSGKAGRTPGEAGLMIINVGAKERFKEYMSLRMSPDVTVTVTPHNRTDTEHIKNPPTPLKGGSAKPKENGKIPYEEIREAWNQFKPPLLPTTIALNSTRKNLIKQAWIEHPSVKWFQQFFKDINLSDHHSGRNDKNWIPEIDWILKNRLKLQEKIAAVKGMKQKPDEMDNYLEYLAERDGVHHED